MFIIVIYEKKKNIEIKLYVAGHFWSTFPLLLLTIAHST